MCFAMLTHLIISSELDSSPIGKWHVVGIERVVQKFVQLDPKLNEGRIACLTVFDICK